MSKYYFFTDIDLIGTQSSDDAFGPTNVLVADQFQVTDWHTASATPKAYAMCSGEICVQPVTGNTDLVNIILKPNTRPQINYSPIAYFVYKGISKDSLITESTQTGDPNTVTDNSLDLNRLIHASQDAWNAITGSVGEPIENILGIHLNGLTGEYADDSPIDNLFYRPEGEFQFPVVNAGMSIGQFDSAGFGMEIIFEGSGNRSNLGNVRSLQYSITAAPLTGGETAAQIVDHWYDKEQALYYNDPCAFFSAFHSVGLNAFTSSGTSVTYKETDLYNSIISKFSNKNRVYIDIRNEKGHALNFYQNYGTDVQMAYESNPFAPKDYYENFWPIIILDTGFPTNVIRNKTLLKIQFPVGDNEVPMIFTSSGYLDNNEETLPTEAFGSQRFKELSTFNNTNGFTVDHITLAIPNLINASPSSTLPWSSYFQVKYFKQFDVYKYPLSNENLVPNGSHFMDNLFPISQMQLPFKDFVDEEVIKIKVYHNENYVDNGYDLKWDYVGSIGIAEGKDNITLFSFPTEINHYYTRPINSFSMKTSKLTGTDFLVAITENYPGGSLNKFEYVSGSPNEGHYLDLVQVNDNHHKFNFDKNLSQLHGITLSKQEYTDIQLLISQQNYATQFPVYLGLVSKLSGINDYGLTVEELELVVRGYVLNNTNYEIQQESTGKIIRAVRS